MGRATCLLLGHTAYESPAPPSKHLSYNGRCLVTAPDFRVGPHKAGNVKTKIMSFSVWGWRVKKRIRGRQAGYIK